MKRTGTSIALFGGLVFASGIVLVPILHTASIDLIAFCLMLMGLELRNGCRKDIKWPAIWCGWYSLLCVLLAVGTILSPTKVKIGRLHLVEGWQSTSVIVMSALLFVWNLANLASLIRGARGLRERGYPDLVWQSQPYPTLSKPGP